MDNCHSTRSTPVTISVTGCLGLARERTRWTYSTWRRVFLYRIVRQLDCFEQEERRGGMKQGVRGPCGQVGKWESGKVGTEEGRRWTRVDSMSHGNRDPAHISMKKYSPVVASMMNSTVPAPTLQRVSPWSGAKVQRKAIPPSRNRLTS
jgi:hypothetical protein